MTAGEALAVSIEVASVDEALEAAIRLGGSVFRGKSEVAGFGWAATLADPEGGRIGVFEPARDG